MKLVLMVVMTFTVLPLSVSEEEPASCRYYAGMYLPPSKFKSLTCCNCYMMLFESSSVGVGICNLTSLRIEDRGKPSISYPPDVHNSKAVDGICKLVNNDYLCESWQQCCIAASECCDKMSSSYNKTSTVAAEVGIRSCPATWDMFSCWDETAPNQMITQVCPDHLTYSVRDCIENEHHYSERYCDSNGVWMNNMSKFGESRYTKCGLVYNCLEPLQNIKHYVEITFEVLSIIAVLPALFIFIIYRTLRDQQRIRLHINLFLSLFLFHFIHMLNELTINHHQLVAAHQQENSVMCRVMTTLTKYSVLSMYFWMLLEGFYLHWLMVNTFHQPKLVSFVLAGWGIPLVVTTAYSLAKSLTPISNTSCWFNADGIDWVVNIPLIACLVLNLVFLINIQRVILTQLQVHQNEPSFYRRAVKATAILVPPFGLVLISTLYSPPPEANMKTKLIYDSMAEAIKHAQGLIISIILCYSNSEVITHLKKSWRNQCCKRFSSHQPEFSMATGTTNLSRRRSSVPEKKQSKTEQSRALLHSMNPAHDRSNNNIPLTPEKTSLGNNHIATTAP